MRIRKNKILKNIKIQKIGYGGVGVSSFFDNKKIIIKGGVLLDSIVDCRVLKDKGDYVDCQLLRYKVLPNWLKNFKKEEICKHNMILEYFGRKGCDVGCGGCKWQIIPYDQQLKLKNLIFKDSLRNILDIVKDKIENILPSPLFFGYRNKVEFSFGYCNSEGGDNTKTGEFKGMQTLGFHRQGRWDQIVDVQECLLISERANNVYRYLKEFLYHIGLPHYNQKTHQGVLRHLVIREGFNTGQILVNLVIATENKLAQDNEGKIKMLKDLINQDEFIKTSISSFVITYNNGLADVVKGNNITTDVLLGSGYIFEKLNLSNKNLVFRISPFSFFQTNTLGAQKLFLQAIQYIQAYKSKDGYDYILDLYCGIGTIGISLLNLGIGRSLIGVEIVEEAVKDALINTKLNGLESRVYFVSGKAEKIVFSDVNIKSKLGRIGLIIVDPPRDGLHKKVIEFLISFKKSYKFDLLYISCNPVTLARDLKILLESKLFELKVLKPIDMFPHTYHIETIAFLN